MCGIAGIIRKNGNVSVEHLMLMTDAIIHRGPDGEGQWINPKANVGMGHRRLSIIDLSNNAKQPMHYLNLRYTIVFNGEIYNYRELKCDLQKDGYTFISESDTEVLLALYDKLKEKCLEQLDGMFAFAIWDELEQKLFCARDRFGEKPFYYTHYDGDFYFASEMKALWAIGIPKVFIKYKFDKFIQHGDVYFDDVEGTFYENIFQLKAAHKISLKPDLNLKQERYWQLIIPEQPIKIDFLDAVSEWEQLFKKSLLRRMRSDVKVGSSLSGGIDSSYIVALICELQNKRINSFSAIFPGFEKDESEYIQAVVDHLNKIDSYKVIPNENELLDDFLKLSFHQEEPFQSASIYAQYKVFELARKQNTIVLIDGQGADELLGGYLPYYEDYLRQLFFWNPKSYKSEMSAYKKIHGDYAPITNYAGQETLRMRLGRYKQKLVGNQSAYPKNYLKRKLVSDLCGQPLQTLLRYADRNSMANSVEVRLPFLNHKLAEWVVQLPDEYFLMEGWFKVLLRNSANKYLPEKVVWRRKKVGYEPPQKSWMHSKELKQKVKEARSFFAVNTPSDDMVTESQNWRLVMAKYMMENNV